MKSRRWLSIFLSISMIICLLPTIVSADGITTWQDIQNAIDSAPDGAEIDINDSGDFRTIVASDTDTYLVIPENKRITLDLDNTFLTRNCSQAKDDGNAIRVYGELTLKGSGYIYGGFSSENGGALLIASTGTVVLDGPSLQANALGNGSAVYVTAGGEFDIRNGYINGFVYGDGIGSVYVENGATIKVSGKVDISGYHKTSPDTYDETSSSLYLSSNTRIYVDGEVDPSTRIKVSLSEDHDGVITSGYHHTTSNFQNDFFTDNDHDYKAVLNDSGEVIFVSRIWHTITFESPDPHGTISCNSEFEAGTYPEIRVTPESGYCLASLKEINVSDPADIRRYYRQTQRYVLNPAPERDMTVQAIWVPISDTVVVKSANLTLNGQILLNIKMQVPDIIANDPGASVLITYRGDSREVPLSSLAKDGGLYIVSQPCAVREFACPVAIRVLDGNGNTCLMTKESTQAMCINEEDTYDWVDGQYVSVTNPDNTSNNHIENEFTYTIEEYKYAVKKGSDSRLKSLIESLNYYAYDTWRFFQIYSNSAIQDHSFVGYDTTTSSTYKNKFNRVTVDALKDYEPTSSGSVTGITVEDMRLTLDSDTTITIRFHLDDSLLQDDILVTAPGINPIIERDGNTLTVKIKNINALNLNRTYTVNLKHGSEQLSFSCSALSYAYIVLSAEDGAIPESYRSYLENVVRSLKVYSDEAHTYFD